MSIKLPEIKEMMKAGLHFGHRTSKWNPKMGKYIFGVKNNVHIFDLEKTRKTLETALKVIEETVKKGGVVLFLGTKKQARDVIKKYAQEVEMPYVTDHWIGGTITNFVEIYKLVKKMENKGISFLAVSPHHPSSSNPSCISFIDLCYLTTTTTLVEK